MPSFNASLIKGDKVSDSTDYRDALPVNMYAVMRKVLGADGYMLSHPGLTLHGTGEGVDRGGYWNERQGIHFRVSGTSLINLAVDGTHTTIGAITGNRRASMAHSFNSMGIVADGKFWQYDGTTLVQNTDPDLGTPIDLTWIDNYYFFTDGEFIYHTDITDETSIDGLKFATSEFSPDPTLAIDRTSDDQLIVFDRYTTNYFTNKATDNFAFQWIRGKSLKCGIVGTHCETELEGRFYIIGSGREEAVSIHLISSGTYTSIASREIDKILAEYTDEQLQSAILETRVEDRDKLIIAHLPSHTLLYNANVAAVSGVDQAWSIIKSGNLPWRGVNGVSDPRVAGFIYGDKFNANIGLLDNTVATQYGETVESTVFTPLFLLDGLSIDEIEVTTIPGHQVNLDDVTCAISVTYDGLTYSNEWWALYGEQYNYNQRFIIRRLGYVRNWMGIKIRAKTKERLSFLFARVKAS